MSTDTSLTSSEKLNVHFLSRNSLLAQIAIYRKFNNNKNFYLVKVDF